MKKADYHEVVKGIYTLKRNVIEPIKPCPICGELPTFCRSMMCYGYCMAATDGIKKCTFKPKINPTHSYPHGVEAWNIAVDTYHHNKLLRKRT